jgi:hypothetical protein
MPALCEHERPPRPIRERERSRYVHSPWLRGVSFGKPDNRTLSFAWRRASMSRQKQITQERTQGAETVTQRFARLAEQWRRERAAMLSSSVARMALCVPYQEIIGLGPDAIRPILNELRTQPDPEHWFWALAAITGQNPVPIQSRGKTKEMAAAWLQWGRDNGYL